MKKVLSVILMAAMVLSLVSVNVLASTVPAAAEPVASHDFSSSPFWGFVKYASGSTGNPTMNVDNQYLSATNQDYSNSSKAITFLRLGATSSDNGVRHSEEFTATFDIRFSGVSADYEGTVSRIIFGDSTKVSTAGTAWLFTYNDGFKTTAGSSDLFFGNGTINQNKWYTITAEINFLSRKYSLTAKATGENAIVLSEGTLFGNQIQHFEATDEFQIELTKGANYTLDIDNVSIYDYVKSEGKIISPANGFVAEGDVPIKLSAYIADAASAWFEINGTKYDATGSDGVFKATIAANTLTAGTKYLDVYSYDASGNLSAKSSSFECIYPVQANVAAKSQTYYWDSTNSYTTIDSPMTKTDYADEDCTDGRAVQYILTTKETYYKSIHILSEERTGRFCFEADVKLNTNNDIIGLEMGDGSATMDIALNNTNAIFCSDGSICNTSVTYNTTDWYKLKIAVDLNADKLEIYIDGDLIKSIDFISDKDKNMTAIKKFRISMNNTEDSPAEGTYAGLIIDNAKTYVEQSAPKITTAPTVVANDANSIAITFDNAFDAAPTSVAVTCGGADVAATPSYDVDTKTLTISGLGALTKSSLLNVKIDGFAVGGATNTKAIDVPLYVATMDSIYVEPAELITTGAKNVLLSKCINGGVDKELKGYIAQKDTNIFNIKSTDVTVKAGKTGFVTLSAAKIATPYGFIWDTNLVPMSDIAD